MEPQDSKTTEPAPVEPATQIPAPIEPAQTTAAPESAKPTKGYGKRPIWQWVLIYVIVAIVVYGLVYILFLRKSGTGSGYGA